MSPENIPFYWSSIFVRQLHEIGIRYAVISPGSRSTPLTLAFAAHDGIEKHVVIDERSAAFLALGIGKSTGNPAVLVCTSGTAVANYLPAVIEAKQSNVPLIVLSADRPQTLLKVGASQTINQTNIFGDYCSFFFNAGAPNENERSAKRLRRAAEQAVSEAKKGFGISHVNFPFRKPLEPTKRYYNTLKKENDEILDLFIPEPPNLETHTIDLNDHIWSNMVASERPVIIVGPRTTKSETNSIINLATTLRAPILAEAGSHLPHNDNLISGYDGFLRSDAAKEHLKPDLIIRFGKQPISKAVFTYLRMNLDVNQISFTDYGDLADEALTATHVVELSGELIIPEVSVSAPKKWVKEWKKVQKQYVEKRSKVLKSANSLTDGFIFDEASKKYSKDAFIMLSNSFPVRDFELIADYSANSFVNRGAAGIDGIISTTMGISIAEQKAGVCFIGDIAFLHDSNGLSIANQIDKPLIFIILNNGGGTVFRMLPIRNISSVYQEYFETPQHISYTQLCRAHGVSHNLVTSKDQFEEIFSKALNRNKVQVIECITNPNSSMKERTRLWDLDFDL